MLLVVYNCTDTSDFIIDVGIKALSKTLLAKDHTWYLGLSNIGILRNEWSSVVICFLPDKKDRPQFGSQSLLECTGGLPGDPMISTTEKLSPELTFSRLPKFTCTFTV